MLRNLNQNPVAGKRILGTPRSGVAGSAIAAAAQHGPSFLHVSLPADADREIRGWVVSPPAAGLLSTFENGRYAYDPQGATGEQGFTFQRYVNGQLAPGAPTQVKLETVTDTPAVTGAAAVMPEAEAPRDSPPALLPGGYPLPADVRQGVRYGPHGELLGTLAPP